MKILLALALLTLAPMALVGCGATGAYDPGFNDSSVDDKGSQKDDLGVKPDQAGKPDVSPGNEAGTPPDMPGAKDNGKPPQDTKPWPKDTKPPQDTKPWPKDTKPPQDSKPWAPDTWPPPTTCATVAGKPCTQNGKECGPSPNTCLLSSSGKGVCTCPCTPDNAGTPQNEDTCPQLNKNICGQVQLSSGAKQNFCLRKCSPKLYANDCAGGMACAPRSAAFVNGKLNQAVCILYGCSTNSDCPVRNGKACSQSNPCTLGQLCIPHNSATTQGICASPGKCDKASKLCGPHATTKPSAKVGDTCSADTHCGANMKCRFQVNRAAYAKKWNQSCGADAECCSGSCQSGFCTKGLCTVDNRNGYCVVQGCIFANTLPTSACPSGSACNILYTGGLCQRTCSLTSSLSCRGLGVDRFGDYECRAWNNLNIGGTPVTTSPVCDFGTGMSCNFLQASKLQCSSVGLSLNTTNMTCRSLANKVLGDPYDPTGYCLDNTASSGTLRSPIPTP